MEWELGGEGCLREAVGTTHGDLAESSLPAFPPAYPRASCCPEGKIVLILTQSLDTVSMEHPRTQESTGWREVGGWPGGT